MAPPGITVQTHRLMLEDKAKLDEVQELVHHGLDAICEDLVNVQRRLNALEMTEEAQAKWAYARAFVLKMHANARKLYGGKPDACEKLRRAAVLIIVTVVNERFSLAGATLCEAIRQGEIYASRLLPCVVTAQTFEDRLQALMDGGMDVGDVFFLQQVLQQQQSNQSRTRQPRLVS